MSSRPPPSSLRFVPFTEVDFRAWLTQAIPSYALSHVEDGRWTLAEAIHRASEEYAELLPQGLATPGHSFVNLRVVGEAGDVGHLWWSEIETGGRRGIYVYGVAVAEAARRRGIARAAFDELERLARLRGLQFLSLHVFGHNHGARRLYDELGFEPTSLTLRKNL